MDSEEIRTTPPLLAPEDHNSTRVHAFWLREIALQLAEFKETLSQGGIYTAKAAGARGPTLGPSVYKPPASPPLTSGEVFTVVQFLEQLEMVLGKDEAFFAALHPSGFMSKLELLNVYAPAGLAILRRLFEEAKARSVTDSSQGATVRVYDARTHDVTRVDRRAWDERALSGSLDQFWLLLGEHEPAPAEPFTCTVCHERMGRYHKISCARQGLVTLTTDTIRPFRAGSV